MPRGRKTNMSVRLTLRERDVLESWQRSTSIRAGLTRRGRIILMLANGDSIFHISRTVGIRRRFVYKWAARFTEEHIAGLTDKPGRGRNSSPLTRPISQPAAKAVDHKANLVGAGDDAGN